MSKLVKNNTFTDSVETYAGCYCTCSCPSCNVGCFLHFLAESNRSSARQSSVSRGQSNNDSTGAAIRRAYAAIGK